MDLLLFQNLTDSRKHNMQTHYAHRMGRHVVKSRLKQLYHWWWLAWHADSQEGKLALPQWTLTVGAGLLLQD